MGALVLGGVSPVRVPAPTDAHLVPKTPPEWVVRATRARALQTRGVATNVHPDLLPTLRSLVADVMVHCKAETTSGPDKSHDPGAALARKLGTWGLRDLFRMDADLRAILLPVVAVNHAVCAVVFSWSTSADLRRDITGDGGSLLHYFAQHGTVSGFDPVTWILARDERCVLEIDQPNARGETPLMCAARAANLSAVKALISARANTDPRDAAGKTAVFHAVDGAAQGPQWFECYQRIVKVSSPDACTMPRKLLGPLTVQAYARKHVSVV